MYISPFYLITDIDNLNRALMSNMKVISMDENLSINNPNILVGTILLPPYESTYFLVDDDMPQFHNSYIYYLQRRETDLFLISIFTALSSGVPIGIYMGDMNGPDAEMTWKIFNSFALYMHQFFGIDIESPNRPFFYNDQFDTINLTKMYCNDLIPWSEFLAKCNPMVQIHPDAIVKLVAEVRPLVDNTDLNTYDIYFRGLSERMQSMGGRPLISPMTIVERSPYDSLHQYS